MEHFAKRGNFEGLKKEIEAERTDSQDRLPICCSGVGIEPTFRPWPYAVIYVSGTAAPHRLPALFDHISLNLVHP